MPALPWIDPENFNPGYMMRGMHLLPKRGDKPEWQHNQDYWPRRMSFPPSILATRRLHMNRPGPSCGSRRFQVSSCPALCRASTS
jgi:hypothetical protein